MATTAATATITQVKGLFVVAVVAADVAEATWVPVGAGVVWEEQAAKLCARHDLRAASGAEVDSHNVSLAVD